MGHILSLFTYILTTSVSGRVPVVLSGGYPGNKLPGYGSPTGSQEMRRKWAECARKESFEVCVVINMMAAGVRRQRWSNCVVNASHAMVDIRATASPAPTLLPRADIKGIRSGDDCRNPIRNNRTSRPCTQRGTHRRSVGPSSDPAGSVWPPTPGR